MNLSDLERIRLQGQRPHGGIVLVRDRYTRSRDPKLSQLLVGPQHIAQDWGPVHGLAVDVHMSTWDPWVLGLLERIAAVGPLALTVWDPVSRIPIYMIREGQAFEPLAIDAAVWDRAAREALRA